MLYYRVTVMQKLFLINLCLCSFILTACDHQTSKDKQTLTVTTSKSLSQNNIADLTADIAALQSLQALVVSDDHPSAENTQHLNQNITISSSVASRDFTQRYDQELSELDLKTIEAHRFRTQLQAFNQLTLQYQQIEKQKNMDQALIQAWLKKLKQAQIELENTYQQMEKTISASTS